MFGSIWNRSSKNYKIPKKKETITLQCGIMRKKISNFRDLRVFNFALYPKSKTQKSGKVLSYLNFWYYMELKIEKDDLKEKTLTLRCGLRRKKIQFSRFPGFRFWPILEIENLEILEGFCLLQFFVVSVAVSMRKIKSLNWISN